MRKAADKIFVDDVTVDLAGNVPQNTIKVALRTQTEGYSFPINLYRTASKIMINGRQCRDFVTKVMPLLLKKLDERKNVIDEANTQFKLAIPNAPPMIIDTKEKNERKNNGEIFPSIMHTPKADVLPVIKEDN